MRIFYLLQQALLASTIARTFSAENHHSRPPKIKQASPHQETTLKEHPLAFMIAENHFMTTLNRGHEDEHTASSMHMRQMYPQVNHTHQHRAAQHTKPRASHKTRERHPKKIPVSLRHPPTKAMVKPHLAMLSLHQSPITSTPSLPPLVRSKRGNNNLISAKQWGKTMRSTTLPSELKALIEKIHTSITQLEAYPHERNQASTILRYSLLRYTKKHVENLIERWPEIPSSTSNAKLRTTKTLLKKINTQLSIYEKPVPKRLSMVWIGGMTPTLQDYLYCILKTTEPGYEAVLLYDPDATLAAVLGKKIKEFSAHQKKDFVHPQFTSPDNTQKKQKYNLERLVLNLQNLAYKEIKQGMSKGISFDTSAINFMVKNLGEKRTALEELRDSHLNSYAKLNDVAQELCRKSGIQFTLKTITKDLFTLPNDPPNLQTQRYNNYILDAGLRNNLAAASDLVRVFYLQQYGGLYRDIDLLPNMRDEIFSSDPSIKKNLRDLISLRTNDASLSKHAFYGLQYEVLWQELEPYLHFQKENPEKKPTTIWLDNFSKLPGGDVLLERLRQAIRHYKTTHTDIKDFFAPLGQVKVGPEGIAMQGLYDNEKIMAVNNNMLAAQPHCTVLKQFIRKLDDTYALLQQPGMGMQYPDLTTDPLPRHNLGTKATIRWVDRNQWRKKQGLTPLTEGPANLPVLPGLRLDGIDSNSKATVFISGPTSLSDSISHYLYTSINSGIYERASQALNIQIEELLDYAQTLPQDIEGEYSTESAISSWIFDAGMRQNNIGDSTQYDHTLILQLQKDPEINLAARFLNNKHPEKTTWLVPTLLPDSRLQINIINQPPTRSTNSNAKIRVILLGHGDMVDSKVQLSNKNGQQLAQLLTHSDIKNKFLAAGQSITRISLVGCNLAGETSPLSDVTTNKFIVDLFNNLKEKGVSVKDITARRGPMLVSPHGKKMVKLTPSPQSPPLWQHEDGKVIFTQDNQGTVHYQNQISYIDTPLSEPEFIVGSAGPLAWGAQSQKHLTTQLTAQFHQAALKIKAAHHLDDDWIPLLNTLENTAQGAKIQWLNTKDPSQGLRHTTAHDPIFSEIKTHVNNHVVNLRTTHEWVDNKLIQKPRTQLPQKTSLLKTIERGANNLLALNTLINAIRHPQQTTESTLDKALKLHTYLSITQATATLTAEASRLFTQHLANKNSANTILAKAEQFGIAINNAANHVFNIANLGFDLTELMLSKSPEQARHFSMQLGFDAGISSSFAIEGAAEAVGVDAIASVTGPLGWTLLAGEIFTLALIDAHRAAQHRITHQTTENVTTVDDYLTTTLHQYRAGGFHFDKKNKALVPLRNVIIKKIDLQNGLTILKSPTLRRIESISVKNGKVVNIPKRVPLEFKATFAAVSTNDPPLSQYFQLPGQGSIQHLKQARIIVLPNTPDTRFNYTITAHGLNINRTSHHNAHLTHRLINKPCQPCTTPYEENLLSLWQRTRLASLQPSYQLTNTTVILDTYPRTLIVPPRQFNHSYMRYEMTGGGSTVTLVPQPDAKFFFNSGTQISRWLIDARAFSISGLDCKPGYLRIDKVEFALNAIQNNDIFMLQTQSNDVLKIDMCQGTYQYKVIDMHRKPLADIHTRLKNLARNKKLMPYVVLINLPGSQQSTGQKTVALFDTQRQLLVPAYVDGAVAVAGVGTKEQSLNPYFFAKTDGSILWRVNAQRQKIAMQWRPLLAEYQEMHLVGVYQKNNITFLEQQIPVRDNDTASTFNHTINLTSVINQNDALKCIDITFPANQLNHCLETLHSFLPTVATTHISNRDEFILRQILPLNDLTPRTEPIEQVDATQHLRPAGYARFVRLRNQENTKSAWLWLEKARLIEPRCLLARQTLPNFAKLLSVSEAEIPFGVTPDGCYFRIHTDDHIEFIGVSRSWSAAHWETLSTDLDHMAQKTTTAPFITLSGLIEYTVQEDDKKIERIIPQRGWYDTQEKQFMIAPSHLNQTHIVYLGSDHSGGGWLYDQKQGHLYYADLVNPTLLKTLFDPDLQAKTADWQVSQRLFSDQSLDNVRRQDDGRVVVCTNDGLIFLVDHHEEESGQGPLLLAVTSNWKNAHEETLTDDLNTLKLRYATSEKIEIINTSNRVD